MNTIAQIEILRRYTSHKDIEVKYIEQDLIDKIWKHKLALSENPISIHDLKYCGETTFNKLTKVCDILKKRKCNAGIITVSDQIAWILNLRAPHRRFIAKSLSGCNMNFSTSFTGYLMILFCLRGKKIILYSDVSKFKDREVQGYLGNLHIKLRPYESIWEEVSKIQGRSMGIDLTWTNEKMYSLLSRKAKEVININIDIPLLKQDKNPIELDGYRKCNIRDGVAFVRYLGWLGHQLNVRNRTDITEYMAGEMASGFRMVQDDFKGLSFATTSAIGSNGSAICHEPTNDEVVAVNKKEIYLINSGAHYSSFIPINY